MRKIVSILVALALAASVSISYAGTNTANGYFYKPSYGEKGPVGYGLYNAAVDRADAALGTMAGASYTTLQEAVTAIGSTVANLRMTAGTYSITDNLTIPSNITLLVDKGVIFSIATAKTLTINGYLIAVPYPIFSCAGTGKVVFGSQKTVYPEWWGALINATATDCGPAFNSALASLTAGGVIDLQSGTYYIATQIALLKLGASTGVTFRGYGGMAGAGSTLRRSADITMIDGTGVSVLGTANHVANYSFDGITFYGNGPAAAAYTSDLISLKACTFITFNNCRFDTVNGRAVFGWELYDSRFNDCYFVLCGKASTTIPVVELKCSDTTYERTNNVYFYGCDFESNNYTCVKTTYVAGSRIDHIYFVNIKFDNIAITGPTLDFDRTDMIKFKNVFVSVLRNVALTELVKFDRCNQVEGDLQLAIQPTGSEAITRVMTINTAGGTEINRANLFLSGVNWDAITEAAAVKIDNVAYAGMINIRTYGLAPGDAGYLCSTKALTNFPAQSEAIYGSSIQTYAPASPADSYMGIFNKAVAGGNVDYWALNVWDNSGKATFDFLYSINQAAPTKIFSLDPVAGNIQSVISDFEVIMKGKGVVMTNAAGTVTKRVRLNDAGDGLIYEAP